MSAKGETWSSPSMISRFGGFIGILSRLLTYLLKSLSCPLSNPFILQSLIENSLVGVKLHPLLANYDISLSMIEVGLFVIVKVAGLNLDGFTSDGGGRAGQARDGGKNRN